MCHKNRHRRENCTIKSVPECWSCHKNGNCLERPPRKCFNCGKIWHIREQCPHEVCWKCSSKYYRTEGCYKNMRIEQMRNGRDEGSRQKQRYNQFNTIGEEENDDIEMDIETEGMNKDKQPPNKWAASVEELIGAIN